jgi:5-methyltetrahydrofolate--homocysteine methyltransferase
MQSSAAKPGLDTDAFPRYTDGMDTRKTLNRIASERVIVLDGAMGALLQSYRLGEADFRGSRFAAHRKNVAGVYDVLCLTRPDLIAGIHDAYLRAGADIIETCSFNANALSLADYALGDFAYEISRAAAGLARKAADAHSTAEKPRFVAGSMGPSNKSGSMSPDMADPGKRAVTWDELEAAFYDNARGLIDGGADLLLVETIFDTLNAKAAIAAINRLCAERGRDIPLMLSATVSGAGGRVISGQSAGAFAAAMLHAAPWALGFNCSFGAEKLIEPVRQLSAVPCLVSAYPNAGLPNALGGYDETPELMCSHIEAFLEEGLVNIIGGCCGSTPDHIALIAESAAHYRPRSIPAPLRASLYAGFEVLRAPPDGEAQPGSSAAPAGLIIAGERANVAGCRKFLDLISAGSYEEALNIPREMIRAGADIINIGMDDPLLDAKTAITRFVNLALADPDIAKKPFMIDSSRWEVIEAAVKCIGGKPLINSISLKEGEGEFLRRAGAARNWGAAVVVMLFDERGQAVTYERKIEIARRAWTLLTGSGFPPEDIVFDPNVLTILTGIAEHDSYALAFIRACAWIRENCPGAQISGGISNLSFSFRGNTVVREAMHAVFLKHAAAAGLTMAIVNPETLVAYDSIDAELRSAIEDVILCRETAPPGPAERLLALALRLKAGDGASASGVVSGSGGGASSGAAAENAWRSLDAPERIRAALIQGDDTFLAGDLGELLGRGESPLGIVEGPLLAAMREVGDLFGTGKMYLPQLIRSARIMQKAVAILKPALDAGKGAEPPAPEPPRASGPAGSQATPNAGTPRNAPCSLPGVLRSKTPKLKTALRFSAATPPGSAGRILLATVRGDVHDIGKNIVSVVLGCSGYEVLDLGVQVSAEEIASRALSEGASAVGLSGLITPSLDEMVNTARELERRGLRVPLLIGGATTSLVHTALRIAPEYSGPVVYLSDAGRAAGALRSLLSPLEAPRFLEGLERRYREAVESHEKIAARRETLSPEEARRNRFYAPWTAPPPKTRGIIEVNDYPLERLIPHIDWQAFLRAFGLGEGGEAGDARNRDAAVEETLTGARALLDRIAGEKLLSLRGAAGIFPAAAADEDLIIFGEGKERARFTFPRNRYRRRAGGPNACLADFVAPAQNGAPADWAGFFALSAGVGLAETESLLKAEGVDEYGILMAEQLANVLAEAFSEEMHRRVAFEYWGYAAEGSPEPALGIRPALGYPACPNHGDKRKVFDLLEVRKRCGLELTETAMIIPAASVCGLYLAHPGSFYFSAGGE